MSDLNTYLAKNYFNAEQFAAACDMTVSELNALIQASLIPAPSYVVTPSATVRSHVFGEMAAPGAIPGDYFHPANVVWVNVAREIVARNDHQTPFASLKERYCSHFQKALSDLNITTWRLKDCFHDDGAPIKEGLHIRTEFAWEQFLLGTFGLCIANPISEAEIALKEVLQEKLVALSENGSKITFNQTDAKMMLTLIDAYQNAAMPFSPVEYHLSSRKRLVDDLRRQINQKK
ncbi:DUF6058 family natural product biosynthesis protein [Glaciimonas soli]|uniref:Uncharacterized protein n=1 Tax=Glaciimonas soli TaxID=2590999 RepID=A0A843YWE8_9BURK|nr:DUF6058 family natural product biosynthesis protein [Glaciimonas soli]MQR00906.1 hypothetical protein [Glaciimonas soli]